jgi:hypothetical protein
LDYWRCFALSVFCFRGGRSQVRWVSGHGRSKVKGQQSSSVVIGHRSPRKFLWSRSTEVTWVSQRASSLVKRTVQRAKFFRSTSYHFFCYGSFSFATGVYPSINISTAPYFSDLSQQLFFKLLDSVLLANFLSTLLFSRSRRSFGFLRLLFSSFRAWFCVMM